MEIYIGITPGPDAVHYAKLAEDLGYRRAWLYDSAALYEDIWINIANVIIFISIFFIMFNVNYIEKLV